MEILQVIWKNRPTDAVFVETYLQGLAFVQEQVKVKLYCTDLTLSGPLEREQEAWLNNHYYSKVHDTIQEDFFVAVVFSEDHFKAIVTNYTATEPAEHSFIHFNYFTDRAEAILWLESEKKGRDAIMFPTISQL
ncbi:hypothetical protein H7F15_03360 [Pontibacter sp. Tf4]|uniref:hypothetical protein n=1 Tax=Pontibacter sp. Tf4 TaxID=2761620 RepID=UPI001628DD1D|nr:hypothetical protein [Pontibacter sp. Tf4]MBB6610065.1 hypothetical protein [Pontibacter sp. Tf4]